MALNPKQKKFCEEYLVDLNATQAAIRAGYSKKTAGSIGDENLKKPEISKLLTELMAKRSERVQVDADYVMAGFKEIAERCLQRIPVMTFDYKNKMMVQVKDEDDNNVWQFDSSGANKAFENMGKHIGFYERDNGQKKPEVNIPLNDDQVEKVIAALKKLK